MKMKNVKCSLNLLILTTLHLESSVPMRNSATDSNRHGILCARDRLANNIKKDNSPYQANYLANTVIERGINTPITNSLVLWHGFRYVR